MQFKTLALATTSLVALGLTAPAQAAGSGGMWGDVSLGYGQSWYEVSDGSEGVDTEYPSILGQARVNLPTGNNINVQADFLGRVSLDDSLFSGKSLASDTGYVVLGGHINHRDEQGLLGVFGGAGRVYEFFGAPVFMAGIEGQYYCNQWTLTAQVGYLDSDESFLLRNAGFVQGGVIFYPRKDLKIAGSLAYINGEQGLYSAYSADVEELAWSVSAAYWMGKSIPASVFVEYRGRSAESEFGGEGSSFSVDTDEHTVNGGFRFHFGGDGFEDADRNGASTTLPDPDWFRLTPAYGPI